MNMLTQEQQKWIDHLSDTKTVSVVPFDPTSEEKFLKAKKLVQDILGLDQDVVHSGASSLGISGQDEIDIYVPVSPAIFDKTVASLSVEFGEPQSVYPLKRARFATAVDGKHVDVFVINQDDADWTESVIFMSYLRTHPATLENYRKLKEDLGGKSVREYYRIKKEFINGIIAQARVDRTTG